MSQNSSRQVVNVSQNTDNSFHVSVDSSAKGKVTWTTNNVGNFATKNETRMWISSHARSVCKFGWDVRVDWDC